MKALCSTCSCAQRVVEKRVKPRKTWQAPSPCLAYAGAAAMAYTYILGISAFYHDSAACLLREGEIGAAAQEERFSREKGDASFPAKAGGYCRNPVRVPAAGLAFGCVLGKAVSKFAGIL